MEHERVRTKALDEELSALDQTAEGEHQVIITNYVESSANCVDVTALHSVSGRQSNGFIFFCIILVFGGETARADLRKSCTRLPSACPPPVAAGNL